MCVQLKITSSIALHWDFMAQACEGDTNIETFFFIVTISPRFCTKNSIFLSSMPRLSGPSGWVAQDALIVFSLFCLILASQKVNGKENFGIYIEFENTCEKSVRIWLNGEQPVGEISPGQTSRFPICTDVDCTKAWGLPKAYSYTFGAQTVEDWPCDLQGVS